MDLILRFLIGGFVVSLFAIVEDVLKPKSFAGLFAAAPSIAMASLGLAVLGNGNSYAVLEARSMILGAGAFFFCACGCTRIMVKHRVQAAPAAIMGLMLWLCVALGGWFLILR